MRILLWNRRVGKTHECIQKLREDSDVICLVPTIAMVKGTYPKDLWNRVFSISSTAWRGHTSKRVILDNVDLMTEEQLRDVSGCFDVILATTTPSTWLSRAIQKHGFEAK